MKIVVLLAVLSFYGCNAQTTVSASDHTALYGSDALIPCRYDGNGDSVTLKWFVAVGSPQLLCSFDVAMSTSKMYDAGTQRSMTCPDGSLKIPSVVFEDNERYGKLVCRAESSNADAHSVDVKLQVVSLADEPEPRTVVNLSPGENFIYNGAPDILLGRCISGFAYPEPTIEFFKGDESLDTDGNLFKFIQRWYRPNGEAKIARECHRTFRIDDDNAAFQCVITSGFGSTEETNLVQKLPFERFRVEHSTTEIDITADKKDVFAGDHLTLTCRANGFPEPIITILASSKKGNVLEYSIDVTRNDHNREILCSSIQPGSEKQFTKNYTVTAYYTDELSIKGPSDIKYGDPLTLECNIASIPSPKAIKWTKNGSVVSTTKTLMISKVDFKHSGVYTCVVENQYEKLNRENNSLEISVSGLGFDDPMLVHVDGSAEDTVDLKCTALSDTEPITFSWKRIDNADKEESVDSEAASKDGPRTYTSEIKVGPLDSSFSDLRYICTASNGKDEDIEKSFLMPNIPTAAAQAKEVVSYTVPAAAVAVVVLAGVLVILKKKGIICKGKKKSKEAVDTTKAATDTAATKAPESDKPQPGKLLKNEPNQA